MWLGIFISKRLKRKKPYKLPLTGFGNIVSASAGVLQIYKKMNIKPLYLFLFVGAFIALAIYTVQLTGSSNAKDDVIEKLKKEAVNELEKEAEKRDEKAPIQEKLNEDATTNFEEGKALEVEKEQLKNPYYENEPYRINNADSLRVIIARRIKQLKNE